MRKFIIMAALVLGTVFQAGAKNYNASLFGIKSDGTADNTASIQKAVDFIAEQGGGTLCFYVGRYITGSVQLRSNVSINLKGGAVIVGSDNIYSYKGKPAIFWAENAENISIFGTGVIDGRADLLKANIEDQQKKGHIGSDVTVPALVSFSNCKGTSLKKFIWRSPATAQPFVTAGPDSTVIEDCFTDTNK